MLTNSSPVEKSNGLSTFKYVLLIDDDPIANFISKKFLKKNKIAKKVKTASNGKVAVQMLNDLVSKGRFPDLVIVDINMPVMNGFEFLDYYEVNFLTRFQATNVLILSSSTGSIDREMAANYGFVKKYMTKPLDFTQLKNL